MGKNRSDLPSECEGLGRNQNGPPLSSIVVPPRAMAAASRASGANPIRPGRVAAALILLLFGVLPTAMFGVRIATAAVLVLALSSSLVVALSRRGFTLEPETRTLTIWWGIGVPLRRRSQALGASTHVSVHRETSGAGASSSVTFLIHIHRSDTVIPAALPATPDYVTARRFAELAAKSLHLPLHDDTSGTLVVREAGSLDEPFGDRMLRTRGGAPAPVGPPPRRFALEHDGPEQTCTFPSTGLLARPKRVTFSPAGVTYRAGARTRHLPEETIEELFVLPPSRLLLVNAGGSVVVRSDHDWITIGRGLHAEEQQWLRDAIANALVAGAVARRHRR